MSPAKHNEIKAALETASFSQKKHSTVNVAEIFHTTNAGTKSRVNLINENYDHSFSETELNFLTDMPIEAFFYHIYNTAVWSDAFTGAGRVSDESFDIMDF